ncbi:MAG TPA: hypothetical protein VNH84_16645 [Candidatus Saccharimonadales bacterium]|jgi:hypothetical protein|nr:hypothetical protein [Candidatus Saccharimonadales bacterium]
MIYYTVFVKGLNNSTGYIDVALADDQLLKDFLQYLDVGIKPHRSYAVTAPPKAQGKQISTTGVFVINLSDVTAITAMRASP